MKKILISGASRGIGKGIADLLKSSSYEVFGPSSQEMNLKDEGSIEKYIEKNIDSDLYALIANGGIFHSASLEKHSIKDFQEVIDVNLIGTFRLIKSCLKYLKTNSHIIIISSVSAEGEAFAPAYSASKAGLNGLCKSLAQELGGQGINVNAIAPGWVRTDMAKNILNTLELEKDHLGATLQNRWIETEEIAHLVKYLISPEAKAITGQIITIDAGL